MLSRGDKFVIVQNIASAVDFLKLDEKTGPVLPPAELVERSLRFIDAALTIIPLMPEGRLDNEVPNRPRRYGAVAHHMFRIQEAFVEVAGGTYFSAALPGEVRDPADMASAAALCAYGRRVRDRVAEWWRQVPDKTGSQIVETYYGPQTLHEVQERATWHIAQHCRQWMMLLEMAGVACDPPLSEADFAGLPMPKQVWDG